MHCTIFQNFEATIYKNGEVDSGRLIHSAKDNACGDKDACATVMMGNLFSLNSLKNKHKP